MALVADTPTVLDETGGASTWTLSHTVASATGNMLIVKVQVQDSVTNLNAAGVTYGGVAMTQIGITANGSLSTVAIYKLANPTVGTANVVISWGLTEYGGMIATCWSGVDVNGTPHGTYASTTGNTGTTASLSGISTGATEVVVDIVGLSSASSTPTVGGGQTLEGSGSGGLATLGYGGSHKTNGSTMSWTITNNATYSLAAVSLKPAIILPVINITPSFGIVPPQPPTFLSAAINGVGSMAVTIRETYDGGSPITSYTVTSTPGGFTGTGSSSPVTVSGLANNTSYTFAVTSITNAKGTNTTSSPSSSSQTTATVPGAPTSVVGTVANASTSISFTATFNGGLAISTYNVNVYRVSDNALIASNTGSSSPVVVTGLTNGVAYYAKVSATNAVGTGSLSTASSNFTPASIIAVSNIATGGGSSITTAPATLPSNPSASNTVFCLVAQSSTGTGAAVVKTNGGATYFSLVGTTYASSDGLTGYGFNLYSVTGITTTDIVVTCSSAQNYQFWVFEATNCATDVYEVGPVINDGSGSSPGLTVTPTHDGDLIIAGVIDSAGGSFTPTSTGLTSIGQISYVGVLGEAAYYVQGTHTSYNATFSDSLGASATWSGAAWGIRNAATMSAPSAPTGLSYTTADSQVTVNWTNSTDDGGSPITQYAVEVHRVSDDGTVVLQNASFGPATLTGLTNGVAYYVKVGATNAIGVTYVSTSNFTPAKQTLVQTNGNVLNTLASSWSVGLSATTVGNTIIALVEYDGTAPTSFGVTHGGNALTAGPQIAFHLYLFYGTISTSDTSVAFSTGGSRTGRWAAQVYEFSGVGAIDQSVSASASSVSYTTGHTNELVIGAVGKDTSGTITTSPTGWNMASAQSGTNSYIWAGYMNKFTTGSDTPTFSSGSYIVVATFQ